VTSTATALAANGNRRLEQLYEISKLFASFDGEDTLDTALQVIADKLPLESAILIESVVGGHTDMVVWPSEGGDPARLLSAKAHATGAYAYMVGTRSSDQDMREEAGHSTLPQPHRDHSPADANRFIVLPLVVGRRAVFGALQLEGATRLDRDDLEFVNAVVNQLAIALDRNRAWSYDVLRRREAQISQAKYETLVDELDYAFVWEADADTRRLLYVSAQFEQIIGETRQKGLAEPDWWSAHVYPADCMQLRQTFERALGGPGNQRCEHRCLAADGTVRWLRTSIHLVDAGETPRFQGVSFDVTATRRIEDQVREQLAFSSAMAGSLAEGTLAVDLAGRITFINDAAVSLLGCGGREALGKLATDVGHIETIERAHVEALAEAIRTGGRVRSDDHMLVRADGSRFPATYTAAPIVRDGNVIGAVVAFDNISEQRKAQEAERFLLGAGIALSASLESAAVANVVARLGVPLLGDVCVVDVLSADDLLVRVAWAHSDPAAQSELDQTFGLVHRLAVVAREVTEVLETGRTMRAPMISDAWFSIADLPAPRSALIVPLTLGDRQLGALTFYMTGDREHGDAAVALAEDLARRSALAIENARLYEEARHAISVREQTLAIVSHDLRSPLATIVLASTILGDDEMLRTSRWSQAVVVEKIQTAASRMDRLIGDLLDFVSIEAGKLSIIAKPQSVATIIDESTVSFEPLAKKRGITLTGVTPDGMPAIQCDRDRILQVIGNLLGNALKITPRDATVSLRAEQRERDVVISISDTGPGIDLADQKRLFERYWRSKDATYKGTGLGLAIAQGIVEAHGGLIWVESVLGHGATFSFSVPTADPR
jgi:PAS domain S-box-containing protein